MSTTQSLVVFLCLLASSALVLEWATTHSDSSSSVSRELLDIQPPSGTPSITIIPPTTTRATFTQGTVSGRLCAANENGTCNFVGYAEAIGRMTIPAIILAPLSFIAFWAFCCVRCCCNGFGGFQRTPGNFFYGRECCGRPCFEGDFEGYSVVSIWVVRIFYVVMVIGLIVVAIPGFVGNSKLSQGITKPGLSIVSFGQSITSQVNEALAELSALPYTSNVNASTGSAFDAINQLLSVGDSVNGNIKKADGIRQPIYIVIMILAPIVAIFGLIGGLIGIWKIMFAAALMFFWMSLLIWLVFGIQYPLLIAFSDTCAEMNIWNYNVQVANATLAADPNAQVQIPARQSVFEALVPITSCSNTTFGDLKAQATKGIETAYKSACQELQYICGNATEQASPGVSGGRPTCCSAGSGNSCNNARAVASQPLCQVITAYYADNAQNYSQCEQAVNSALTAIVLDPYYVNTTAPNGQQGIPLFFCDNVTITNCSTNCHTQQLRDGSNTTVYNIQIGQAYLYVLYNKVFPLLSCFIFNPLINDITDAVCDKLVVGLNTMEQVFLCIAILLIPSTILAILAAKRWRIDSHEPHHDSSTTNVEMTTHDVNNYIPASYQPSYTSQVESEPAEQPPAYSSQNEEKIGHSSEPYHQEEHQPEPEGYNPAYSPEPERLDRSAPETPPHNNY